MIKMVEIIKKYWLVEVILVVAIIGLVVLWVSSPKTGNQKQNTIPAPTNTVQIIPSLTPPPAAGVGYGPFVPGESTDQITSHVQQLEQNKNDYPLAALLPYKTDLFTVDHYRSPRLLVVMVKSASDEKIAGQQVGEWLVKNGLAANSHQIVWVISN
jgi:hypothetical protein